MTSPGRAERIGDIMASESPIREATAWFERLYAEAAAGRATVPWDRGVPHWSLVRWAQERAPEGHGERAIVVGCGTGDDAAYVASFGYGVTAFDISSSAIRAAQERYPDAGVDFVATDLFDVPATWRDSFDLVVESQTVQALPRSLRSAAIAAIAGLVAPGGHLVVLAAMGFESDIPRPDPPWPLTRADIDRFTMTGLHAVDIAAVPDPNQPTGRRWCAEFHRPSCQIAVRDSGAGTAVRQVRRVFRVRLALRDPCPDGPNRRCPGAGLGCG